MKTVIRKKYNALADDIRMKKYNYFLYYIITIFERN